MINLDEIGVFDIECKETIVANGELEWKLSFTSLCETPKNASIKIVVPAYQHQRSEEYVQTYDYWKPNYIYAYGEEDEIKVDVKIERIQTEFSHIRNWNDSLRVAIIYFENGLKNGDKIHVKFGGIDRPWIDGECKPSTVTQFAFRQDENYLKYRVFFDLTAKGEYEEIDVFPKIKIIPDKPVKIKVTSENCVKPKCEFSYTLQVLDRFQNVITDYDTSDFCVELVDLQTEENTPIGKMCMIDKIGFYKITVANSDFEVEPSVVLCDESDTKIFWGDTHAHSNLTANIRDSDPGASPEQCYKYAKELALLDFVAITEQTFKFDANRALNIDEKTWGTMGEKCDAHNVKDEFITFCGFELHGKRGDTVVLFKDSLSKYKYPTENVETIQDVWEYYKGQEFMSIPHLHRYCNGRATPDQQDLKHGGFKYENWQDNSENETLCEIFSTQWGRFENENHPMLLKARRNVKGNTVVDFLKKGKKWGFVSDSDGHDGNPGYGGITGVLAGEKSREAIFSALSDRKTIASTHKRIVIVFNINEATVGDTLKVNSEKANFDVKVLAPTKIKIVEIIKNGEAMKTYKTDKLFLNVSTEENINSGDFYYLRVKLEDGHFGWCSPIFIE